MLIMFIMFLIVRFPGESTKSYVVEGETVSKKHKIQLFYSASKWVPVSGMTQHANSWAQEH